MNPHFLRPIRRLKYSLLNCNKVYLKLKLKVFVSDKIRDAILSSPNYPGCGLTFETIDDFSDAVHTAASEAEEGDIVLLSPACAAFDRFKNFAERGRTFKKLVMEL